MKRYILQILTTLAALLVAVSAWGQTNISGTWAGGELTGSYKLTGNTTLTKAISIGTGTTLTVDLNGYTLDRKGTKAADFVFLVDGTLNIIDNSTGKTGKIKGGKGDRGGCALISGTVNFSGGEIMACVATDGSYGDPPEKDSKDSEHYITQGSGGAFFVNSGAILNMSGTAKISSCSTEKTSGPLGHGGAVFVAGTFNMSGGTITGCKASLGGAVYVFGGYKNTYNSKDTRLGVFKMSGGTIEKCGSDTHGSGVYTHGEVNISGTATITQCKPISWSNVSFNGGYPQAQDGGGYGSAIYADGSNANITMSGGTLSQNLSGSGGAVMLWTESTMTMTGGTMDGNYAIGKPTLGNGGAVYLQTSTFNFYGGTLSNNTANRYGGAINTNQGATLVIGKPGYTCEIRGNKASHGGGISQEAGECSLTLASSGIDINNNYAHGQETQLDGTISSSDGNGGGLFIEKGTLTFSAGMIRNNTATGHGGGAALYVRRIHGRTTTAEITGGEISGNKAKYGGGIDLYGGFLSLNDGEEEVGKSNLVVNFSNGILANNTASIDGAGIYVSFNETYATATMTIGTVSDTPVINNNVATQNGGGFGMTNQGVITVNNISASGNKAANGGAIWLGSGTFTLANANLTNNIASQNGGGIYVGSGTFKVNGAATLKGNKATAQNGGGIYLGNGTFTVSNAGSLTLGGDLNTDGNLAGTNGGGLYCKGAFTVNGISAIKNNTAASGGGIYIDGANTKFANITSLINNKASNGNGGAVYVTGGSVTMNQNTITGNSASNYGGAIYVTGTGAKFISEASTTIDSNSASNGGGAIYIYGDNAQFSVTGNASISSNTANNGDGGALYLNGTEARFYVSGDSTISSNSAKGQGGAIYLSGTNSDFQVSGITAMDTNTTEGNGGAVYVDGGNVSLTANSISGNRAGNGGAIYLNGGGFTATGNTTMSLNSAAENGGSVYVSGGDIEITGSSSALTLSGNNAANGGAFYVNNGNIDAHEISNATITGNNTTADGGAFYVTGGMINLCKTELSGNAAEQNGGAIALYNGTFSFKDGSEIKNNTAVKNGGGLYISNASQTEITCVGGSYNSNTAELGGGIYAEGPITLTFAANVEDNSATNGGGLYLADGVDMTFGYIDDKGTASKSDDKEISGLIVRNEATGTGTNGVGGGIYLAAGKLSFAATTNLGIYNNAASYEAADIFASGVNTTINLPYVKGLNLAGFDVPGSELYWVNDFNEVDESSDKYGRYEAALRNINVKIEDMILSFTSDEITNKLKVLNDVKTCLDLGYDLVFVTFTPVNLATGDNAAIVIYYPESRTYDSNGIITAVTGTRQYRKLLLTGAEPPEPQTIGLPSGYWYFDTTGWTYAYADNPVFSPASGSSFTKTLTDSNDNTKTFVEIKRNQDQDIKLTFTPKTDDEFKALVKYSTMHINKMKPGGSSTH